MKIVRIKTNVHNKMKIISAIEKEGLYKFVNGILEEYADNYLKEKRLGYETM